MRRHLECRVRLARNADAVRDSRIGRARFSFPQSGSMACKEGAPVRTLLALVLTVSIAAFAAGCRTEPLPIGPDTYRVSSRTSSGGTAPAREAAVSAAGQQCARLSKQLLVLSSATNIGSTPDEGVVDVTFRCLAAGDPELRRQDVQPAPDVVIENGNAVR
jgi:hypothetical protein